MTEHLAPQDRRLGAATLAYSPNLVMSSLHPPQHHTLPSTWTAAHKRESPRPCRLPHGICSAAARGYLEEAEASGWGYGSPPGSP